MSGVDTSGHPWELTIDLTPGAEIHLYLVVHINSTTDYFADSGSGTAWPGTIPYSWTANDWPGTATLHGNWEWSILIE